MNAQQFAGVNQYAYIWNYNAHVEHQHNYYGGKPEKERAEEPTAQLICRSGHQRNIRIL